MTIANRRMNMYSVSLGQIAKEFNLKNLTEDIDINTIDISEAGVNRPGIHLAGFF